MLRAVRVVWEAGRTELLTVAALQLAAGTGLAAMLLIGRGGLDAVIRAVNADGSLRTVLPWAVGLAVVASAQTVAAAVQAERVQILSELLRRHVEQQVIDVATAVELTAFETPAFHNRVQRIGMAGHQAMQVVQGLTGLLRSAVSVVGVLAALVAIEPVLVPLIAVVFVPAWVAASRRGEAFSGSSSP
jgi:ATP-binding cassette subfamily B protein